MWYWRQAMKAIPVSFFKEIQGHTWIAARALLTGWGMWILCGKAMMFPFVGSSGNGWDAWIEPGHPIQTAWSFVANPVTGPIYIAGLSRVFSPVFAVALTLIVGAMCGWLVASFHRDQQTGVVLLFAGSLLLMHLVLFGPVIFFYGPSVAYIVGPLAANVAASVLGILLGGGLLRDNSRTVSN